MRYIKKILIHFLLLIIIIVIINPVNAEDNATDIFNEIQTDIQSVNNVESIKETSQDLENQIASSKDNDVIIINPGTYKIHNIKLTKNITFQGNGNLRDIIIDGEKKSSIFLIRSPDIHVTFKNITFINGLTENFGGVISIETGNAYVDNCIFINNTALKDTNAGAISNYGTKENRAYLFVNNSLFINNHADHDGGAITTCYADCDIYNCVFINNSAVRDGGAIRVSVFGYGNVQDCIFMFNHADEWGGAYYSWSGESNIERCIFMNNTAGTNGGAVMVSGNINLENSIIVNNNGGETGGSFYIQQPMYDAKTTINVHNNIITNNSSPKGKEIFIKWDDIHNLYTQFDDNDWGDEDPNDPSVNDPNNVTSRSKVSRTIKSNLFKVLNVDLLDRYTDLLTDYFTEDSLENLKNQFENDNNNNDDAEKSNNHQTNHNVKTDSNKKNPVKSEKDETDEESNTPLAEVSKLTKTNSNSKIALGNSTSQGKENKAYELNESDGGSVAKQTSFDIKQVIVAIALVLILLAIGYKRFEKE